jgi:peroxiredoxin
MPEAPAAPVGTNVGERAPDFTLKSLSGTVTSADLLKSGRPLFLFFHSEH